jgi:hypothetical protein
MPTLSVDSIQKCNSSSASMHVCVCRPPVTRGVDVKRAIPIASDPPPMTSPPYPGARSTTPPDPLGGVQEGFSTLPVYLGCRTLCQQLVGCSTT